MYRSMFSQSSVLASVCFVTALRAQSSPDYGLDSSSTTTIDGANSAITLPSPEVIFSWLPVATLYSSVDIDAWSTVTSAAVVTDLASGTTAASSTVSPALYSSIDFDSSSTVTPAAVVTDLASETGAASSTDTPALYSDVDPDGSSTSPLGVAQSIWASWATAASLPANTYPVAMTVQTSDEPAATSTTNSDIQQSPTTTDAPTAASTTATGLDTGLYSSTPPVSTAFSTPSAQTSSPTPASSNRPMSSLPQTSIPTSTSMTTTPTAISATAASSTTTPSPTSLAPTTTSDVWPSSTKTNQPNTMVTQTTIASSSALAFHGGKCEEWSTDCKLYEDKENMICNVGWLDGEDYHNNVLISCRPKSVTCTGDPTTTTSTTEKRHRHYRPSETFQVNECPEFCRCKDGALSCGTTYYDDGCNGRCSNKTITEAFNCNWDADQNKCVGDINNWQVGGCACPNKGTKWPGQS